MKTGKISAARVMKYVTLAAILAFVIILMLFMSGSTRPFDEVKEAVAESLDPDELTEQDGKILRMPVRELHNLPWEGRETEGGIYCWKDETVCVRVREIRGGRAEIRLGRDGNCLTIRTSGNRVELSFLNGEGEMSACGGGRRDRIGYVEEEAEELFLVIDSSIAEIFVNNGETVLTTRFYLGTDERGLSCKGGGRFEILAI